MDEYDGLIEPESEPVLDMVGVGVAVAVDVMVFVLAAVGVCDGNGASYTSAIPSSPLF